MWTVFAVILLLVAGYIYAQYRFAQKPSSLAGIPEYPLVGSSYPIADLTPGERTPAEQTLQQLASTVVPGYHVEDQRFLAAKTAENNFIGDALRSEVIGYLNRGSSYEVTRTHSNMPQNDLFYIAWRHSNPLQRLFNNQIIMAAALLTPVRPTPGNEQIHVYGYFKLTPN
jgi:hypothetical protein